MCLIGPMASGKTTLGRAVARLLGVPFIDTDALIVTHHGPIADIFRDQGESEFRRIETEALHLALDTADMHGGVVATGGGAVVTAENRRLLHGRFTVYLNIDLDTVAPRIERERNRPLLTEPGAESPVDKWQRIMGEREPLYRGTARHLIDVRTGSAAENAEKIVGAYRREHSSLGGT
nr:shikimate kinase [Zhihengliuella flava]